MINNTKKRPMYLRPYHPSYIMIYYGRRKENWGERSEKKWRWLIERIDKERDLKVRIVESYDDACSGCHLLHKTDYASPWGYGYICQSAENSEVLKDVAKGNKFFCERLGLFFGDEISMRNLVELLLKKMPVLEKKIFGSEAQKDYAKGLSDYWVRYGLE